MVRALQWGYRAISKLSRHHEHTWTLTIPCKTFELFGFIYEHPLKLFKVPIQLFRTLKFGSLEKDLFCISYLCLSVCLSFFCFSESDEQARRILARVTFFISYSFSIVYLRLLHNCKYSLVKSSIDTEERMKEAEKKKNMICNMSIVKTLIYTEPRLRRLPKSIQ